MKFRNYILIIGLLISSTLSFAQSSINEFLLYHNKNEKVDFYYLFDDYYRIVYSRQLGSEPISIRLMSRENLVLDTLKYQLYPEGFHKIDQTGLMISGINTSIKLDIIDGKFNYENKKIVEDAFNGTNRSLIKYGKTFSWESNRQGRKFINLRLILNNDKILINKIPKIYRSPKDNPTAKQRFLNLSQFVYGDYLISYLFRSQRVYFINMKDLDIKYYDLPRLENSVWYFFTDTFTGLNYLIRENKNEEFVLYSFSVDQKLIPLKKIDQFPEGITDNKLIIKKSTPEGTYHYGIPISTYKSLDQAKQIIPLEEVEVQGKNRQN